VSTRSLTLDETDGGSPKVFSSAKLAWVDEPTHVSALQPPRHLVASRAAPMSEDDVTDEDETSETDGVKPDSSQEPRDSESSAPRSSENSPVRVPFVQRRTSVKWRTVGLALGATLLLALLGIEIAYITRSTSQNSPAPRGSAAPSSSAVLGQAPSETTDASLPNVPIAPASSDDIALSSTTVAEDEFVEEPRPTKPEKPRHFKTVQDAATASCSTSSVDGLSQQIIEQVRCTNPNAFVPLPSRPNLALDAHIFPYLELSARDHLVRALDSNRQQKMTVHSALRTVAQQYLVWRWAANRRCGVQMATPPGSSNHETGRALDIADHAHWRPALEAEDFHWLGTSDLVHFDFKTSRQLGLAPDVLAFQLLWNRNHSDDKITESGRYDPTTEQRLKKAPPGGFATGPTCSKKSQKRK